MLTYQIRLTCVWRILSKLLQHIFGDRRNTVQHTRSMNHIVCECIVKQAKPWQACYETNQIKTDKKNKQKTFLCISHQKSWYQCAFHTVELNHIYDLSLNILSQTKHLWIYRHITHFLDVQKSFAQLYFYLKAFAQSMIK